MAHSYTPGLKVLHYSKIEKNRRLPIKGEVCKSDGEYVDANEIVAKTNLPGNVHMVKVANLLNISPADLKDVLKVKEGDVVTKGDIIAENDGLFGFFKSEVKSPISGTVESISEVTGQIALRDKPIPVEIDAYVEGKIKEIIAEEGVIIESDAAYIQGIFGIGGESRGNLHILVSDRNDEIPIEKLDSSLEGKIIVGGSFISLEAYKKALELKIAGIIVGGFNYFDLKEILGYTLGVAITGTEDLITSLIITEGYGKIKMGDRTFNLLKSHDSKFVSINGATQIRAGVIRPEIVIPLKKEEIPEKILKEKEQLGIREGSHVRIIRAPYFGKIGEVVSLPSELQKMESETMVRVAEVKIDNMSYIIPRSNLEMLETD